MTAVQWMLLPLKRYVRFTGRARPKEYWMFILFVFLGMVALTIVESIFGLGSTINWADSGPWWAGVGYSRTAGPLVGLFTLAMIVPHLAVGVRRLHDTDRSGWWWLLAFLPLVGGLVLLVFFIMSGTRGANRYGADPVEVGER